MCPEICQIVVITLALVHRVLRQSALPIICTECIVVFEPSLIYAALIPKHIMKCQVQR